MTHTVAMLKQASNKVFVAQSITQEALEASLQGCGTDTDLSIRRVLAYLKSADAEIEVAIALAQGGH